MKTKTVAWLLLFAMIVTLASCGSGGVKEEAAKAMDTTAPAETEAESPFKIPKEDNAGRTFSILVPTDSSFEFPTDTTGEVMNDTLHERNKKVEDHFGIRIKTRIEDGGWDQKDVYNGLIEAAVLAGTPEYDLAEGLLSCSVPAYLKGIYTDVNSLADLDLDNPWWFAGQKKDLSINGKLFFAVGDASITVYKNAVVTYFNKQVLKDNGMTDPYALVNEGKWTMGKMLEMAEAAAVDLNGDGVMKPDDDRLGCYLQDVPLRLAGTALEVALFRADNNGKVIRDTAAVDRLVKAYEYTKIFFTTGYLWDNESAVDFPQFAAAFAEDRSLFHISYLYVTEGAALREMKSDFGILPYPKLDEDQKTHVTPVATSTTLLFIPQNASDANLTARALEAMGWFNMSESVPRYYNVALAEKYTRDREVQDMLVIIRDTMRLPFDSAYGTTIQLNSGASNPGAMLAWANKEMVSFYESKVSAWDGVVVKMNEYKGS